MAILTADPDLRRDAKVVGLVGAAHFTSHFYLLVLPPLFPILKQEFGVGYAALGLLVTISNIATGVAQIPVGLLVDRLGAARLLVAGQAMMAAAILAAGLTASYQALLFVVVFVGLANTVYHPAGYAIMSASVETRRLGRAFSIHTFTGYLGWTMAPVTVIALTQIWDWRTALVTLGASGLVVTAVLILGRGLLRDDVGPENAPESVDPAPVSPAAILLKPSVLLMFGFYMVVAAAYGGLHSFLVVALNALHDVSLTTATTVLTVYLGAGAVGVLIGGVLADKSRRHERIAAAAYIVSAAIILSVGQVALPALILLSGFALAGIADGLVQPSRDMVVRRIAPPGASGTVFGFVSTGLNVGAACSPILLGWILDQGGAEWLFILVPLFLLSASATIIAAKLFGRD